MTSPEALLRAALICGMRPDGPPAHRSQLFFAIHRVLGRREGSDALQGVLESAVDRDGNFRNFGDRGSGQYVITAAGHERARALGEETAQFPPSVGPSCHFKVTSLPLGGRLLSLDCVAGEFTTRIDGQTVYGTEARRYIEENTEWRFPTSGSRSAPKQVYDYGVAQGWSLEWLGPQLQAAVAVPGEREPSSSVEQAELVEAIRRAFRETTVREGQSEFRRELLRAYGGRCAVTGCSVVDVLEAAHIVPYLGPTSNQVRNGLLLRADVHTLFDRGLVNFEPQSRVVQVHPSLAESEYGRYEGETLRAPGAPHEQPTPELFRCRSRLLGEAGLPSNSR